MTRIYYKEFYAGTVALIPYLYLGISNGFSTQYIHEIATKRPVSDSEAAWIGASGKVLSFLGCLLGGFFMDTIGRKNLLYFLYILYFIGWMAISKSIYFFYGRILLSFANGLGYGCTIYVAEVMQPQHRGAFLSVKSVLSIFGSLFVYFIEYFVSTETTSVALGVSGLVFSVSVFFIPETPYWYMLKNKKEKAVKSLIRLRDGNELATNSEIEEIEKSLDNADKAPSFAEVICNRKWWTVFLFFSVYTVLGEMNGFEMITSYSVQFFKLFNRTGINNQLISIIFMASALVGTVVSVLIVEKLKRTTLAKKTNLINAAFLLVAATSESFFPGVQWSSAISLLCFTIYGATMSVSAFLPWTIISESLPTESRATIFAGLCTEYSFVSFVIVEAFPFVLKHVPVKFIIWSLMTFSLLNYAFVRSFVKDTRGVMLPGNRNNIIIN